MIEISGMRLERKMRSEIEANCASILYLKKQIMALYGDKHFTI